MPRVRANLRDYVKEEAQVMSTDGLALLHFHIRGSDEHETWGVGCDLASDTEATLRAHLARWRPDCELDWVEISPVRWCGEDDEQVAW